MGNVVWKVEPALGAGGAITGVAESGGEVAVCGSNCLSGKCLLWSAKYSSAGKESVTNTGTAVYLGRYHAILAVPGGGFFLAGRQYIDSSKLDDGFVALTDNALVGKWTAATGLVGNDNWNAAALAGSDFVVAGWSATANAGHDGLGGCRNTPISGFLIQCYQLVTRQKWLKKKRFSDSLLVARISSAGGVKWQRTCGDVGKDEFNAVVALANGDIGLAGVTGSKGKGGNDGWFVRLVAIGELADDRA